MATIIIDYTNRKITASKTYLKKAHSVGSKEYVELLNVKKQFPNYEIEERKIKTNSNKKVYEGLTYEYMERYIDLHDPSGSIIKEYWKNRLIGECHRGEYPKTKKWFLEKFPEIVAFGTDEFYNAIRSEQNIA